MKTKLATRIIVLFTQVLDMATVYSHVGPFVENTKERVDYAVRNKAFMTANATEDEKKGRFLLCYCR